MPFRLEARGQHSMLWSWLSPVLAIVATLIVSTALFAAMGKPAGDALYTFVATHRYRWFGRRDACRVPTPSERGRFLV